MFGFQPAARRFAQQPEKPQRFAAGGMVRGPGTGTSDSIEAEVEPGTFIMPADSTQAIGPDTMQGMGTVPVRLSDGEFEVPPEQAMALGVAVLKAMKDATHAPVNGEDGGQTDEEVAQARGFSPAAARGREAPARLFADGGMVSDVTRVGNSYSGGNVGGSVTVNGQAPSGTFSQVSAGAAPPAPSAAPVTAAVTPAASPAPAAATATPVAATAAATPSPAAPMGWAERNAQRNLEVSASSIKPSAERDAAQNKLMMMSQAAQPPAPLSTAPTAAAAPTAVGFQPASQRAPVTPQMPGVGGFQPRRYADGGVVQDDERRKALVSQIPTGGLRAPMADGSQNDPLNNELGRNVMNTLSAASGFGPMARSARFVGQAAESLSAAPGIGFSNAGVQAARGAADAIKSVGLPAAGLGMAMPVGSMASQDREPATANTNAPNAGEANAQTGGRPSSEVANGTPATPVPASPTPSSASQAPAVLGARTASGSVPETPGLERPNLDMQTPMVRHSGNDWAARKQLENLQTAASSITNQRRWGGQGERSDASQAYQRALANDLSLQGAEGNMAQAAMEQRGANARAQLADVGALDRTLITERGNNARAAITAEGQTLAAWIKARQEAAKEALAANKDNIQQVKDTQDIFSIINEARPILSGATGSLVGAGLDKVAQGVGYTTDGAKATSQLQVLQGALISKMPKMSGPQSDKDVELYKQMAGQIGDPTTPRAQRMAAMDTIESLNKKYLPQAQDEAGLAQVPSGGWFRAPDGSIRRKP